MIRLHVQVKSYSSTTITLVGVQFTLVMGLECKIQFKLDQGCPTSCLEVFSTPNVLDYLVQVYLIRVGGIIRSIHK